MSCAVRSITPCLSNSLFGKCLILCNFLYTAVKYNYFGYRVS